MTNFIDNIGFIYICGAYIYIYIYIYISDILRIHKMQQGYQYVRNMFILT